MRNVYFVLVLLKTESTCCEDVLTMNSFLHQYANQSPHTFTFLKHEGRHFSRMFPVATNATSTTRNDEVEDSHGIMSGKGEIKNLEILEKRFPSRELVSFSRTSLDQNQLIQALFVGSIPDVSNKLSLWEAYRPSDDANLHLNNVGIWKSGNPMMKHVLGEPWNRRTDLSGLLIQCTLMDVFPSNIPLEISDGAVKDVGTFGVLFDIVLTSLNATTKCSRPPDKSWGMEGVNGTWSGMVGELIDHKADISISALDITPSRFGVVDFLAPFTYSRYVLVIKTPSHEESVYTSYIRVFSPMCWIVICLSVTGISLSLYLVVKLEPEVTSFSEVFLIVMGSLCAQGYGLIIDRIPGRTIVLTMFMMSVLLNAFYSSFLISYLTVYYPSLPFNSIEGLYRARNEYKFRFTMGGSLDSLLKESPRETMRNVWNEMIEKHTKEDGFRKSNEEFLQIVLNEKMVFLINRDYFLLNFFNCSYTVLPEEIFIIPASWAMPKDSPLSPIFKSRVWKLLEGGVLDRLNGQTKVRETSSRECLVSSYNSLDLYRLISIFLVLGGGYFLSLTIFIAETFIHRYRYSCNREKIMKHH